jgi:AcrR family transcriptional regulator
VTGSLQRRTRGREPTGAPGRRRTVPRGPAADGGTTEGPSEESRDGRVLRGQRTRARLLEAAIDLFGSRGFEAVGMRDIAARAGVGAPAMYNHFPSKDAVLVAALTERLARFRAVVIAPDVESADPWSRLEGLVRRHVRQQVASGVAGSVDRLLESFRAGQLLPDPAQRIAVQSYLDDYRSLLGAVLEQLRPEPATMSAPVLVRAVIGLCDSAPRWYADPVAAVAAAEDDCWQLVARMMGGGSDRRVSGPRCEHGGRAVSRMSLYPVGTRPGTAVRTTDRLSGAGPGPG